MSFGPSQAQKNANNTQNGITQTSLANSGTELGQGTSALNTGAGNVNSGTNFFNTVLGGNSANTSALLAPTINQNRQTNQQTLQALSTLFNAAFAPSANTQNYFNSARTTAATTLPQIGLAQEGIGSGLINSGNSALNTGATSNSSLNQTLTQQQQMQNQLAGLFGSGLFGIGAAPIPGLQGGSILGSLAGLVGLGCWIAESIYGTNDLRTHILRAWLNGPYRRTRLGSVVMKVYMVFGRRVARIPAFCRVLRPLFEKALIQATRTSTFVEVG